MLEDSLIETDHPKCNDPAHEGQQIEALCLREECKYSSALCPKCILKSHQNCVNSSVLIEDIPQLLKPFLQIQQELTILQQRNHESKLMNKIEQILQPISSFLGGQTLTNLNDLGQLLKKSEFIQREVLILFEQCNVEMSFKDGDKKPLKQNENQKTACDLFKLGQELFDQNKYQEAIECYEEALQIDPKFTNALVQKGRALLILDKELVAMDCFLQALKIDPLNYIAQSGKGAILYRQDKYCQANDCFEQALIQAPQNVTLWINIGLVLRQQQKYQEAIDCFDTAIKIDSKFINGFYQKGEILRKLEKYQESIQCFEQIIQIDPQNILALVAIGITLLKQQKYQESIFQAEQILQFDPLNAKALQIKGQSLLFQKKYQEAINISEKSIIIDPENSNAWNEKSQALYMQCKFQAAFDCIKRAIKINPNEILFKENFNQIERACYRDTVFIKPNKVGINKLSYKYKYVFN